MIKVSIITVCFNSEKTIRKTINSVLSQTYSNIEYIIIDNCSTDDTISIVNSFIPKFSKSKSIKLISEPDTGIYDAMNKGIRKSKGDLIGIINSDDWYEPTAVEIAAQAQTKKPESVIYGMLNIYKDDVLYQIRQNTHYFIEENMFQHPTWFVPKIIYEKYGLFDTKYRIGGDYELANRLILNNVNFIRLEKSMSNFRLGGLSDKSNLAFNEWQNIRLTYGHISKREYDKFRRKIIFMNLIRKTKNVAKRVFVTLFR